MITADCHVHSHHSGDSEAPMRALVEEALQKGLDTLTFTEHLDVDFPTTHEPAGTFDLDVPAYLAELRSLQTEYDGRISLLFGTEIGLQTHCTEENRAFVQAHPFDFVIASLHLAYGQDPYHGEYWQAMKMRATARVPGADAETLRTETEREGMAFYLAATLENLRCYEDYDVLGHLDLVNRYFGDGRTAYDHASHAEVIDEILRLLVAKDKGLDCNTNLIWKYGAEEMNPSREILARFRELGGRIITFGSDAHEAAHVGEALDSARAIARSCGFTEYCVFQSREPVFRSL